MNSERMSDSLKKTSNSLTLLIFGEQPERFAHILIKKEGTSEALVFFNLQKMYTKLQF